MISENKTDLQSPISKEKAVELLFSIDETNHTKHVCFDEYGNYVFPTDLAANTPNTAIGTSSGISFFSMNNFQL